MAQRRSSSSRRLAGVLSGLLAGTAALSPVHQRRVTTGANYCTGEPDCDIGDHHAALLPRLVLGLEGKTAVVTGASKGIGEAVARQFAAEGVHLLHLVARTASNLELLQAELATSYPAVRVVTHAVDLGQRGSAAALWLALDAGPRVDVLVNNAGAIPAGDILTVDEETWRSSWDLKVFGYINLAREAYRRFMAADEGGVILNIIGSGGVRPTFGYIAGATANAGLIAFTEALGAESLKHGIRVLGVNPGPTLTSRLTTLIEQGGVDNAEEITEGPFRATLPQEVADTVVFLCSDKASQVSGTVLTVDNGRTKRG